MSISSVNDKILTDLQKAKVLIEQKKFNRALNLLEDLQKHSKKHFPGLIPKISPKIILLANKLFSSNPLQSFLQQSESAIYTYLLSCPRVQIPEKHLIQILKTFNSLAGLYRRFRNTSQAFSYFSKAEALGIKPQKAGILLLQYLAKLNLNISSFMTELGNYKDCIRYAKEALKVLQINLKLKTNNKLEVSEIISAYTLAFLNIADAQEALGHKLMMKEALDKAVEVSAGLLNKENPVFVALNSRVQGEKDPKLTASMGIGGEQHKKNLKTFHLDLEQATSCVRFNEKKNLMSPQSEPKVPGRYYTKNQLKLKEKLIETEHKPKFISADQFFFNEVSKVININGDEIHLKPSFFNDNKAWILQENREKRKISELRLKKQFRLSDSNPSIPVLSDRIKVLKGLEKEEFQKQNVKMKKILISAKSKELVQKLCKLGRKKLFPCQSKVYLGLCFKAPITLSDSSQSSLRKLSTVKRVSIYQHTKDEIEELMENINNEIQGMYTSQGSSKFVSPIYSGMSFSEGSLSKSASKSLKSPEKTVKILKNSLKSTMKPAQTSKKELIFYSIG